jgi:diphosphomevalonate decarboxylase
MNKNEAAKTILKTQYNQQPINENGEAFAPSNIALCKYWGKRNLELNLPITSSLSISLGDKGAHTSIEVIDSHQDKIYLNNIPVANTDKFAHRITKFLDPFRTTKKLAFAINTKSNIPIGSGVASSACGFAALTKALNNLFGWNLTDTELSILARLGSGSACRSLWHGFVKWEAGIQDDGMDSYATKLNYNWPDLRIGLLLISDATKPISSTNAMLRTVNTSSFYKLWPQQVAHDLVQIEHALQIKDFQKLGETAELNALAMHATMLTSNPPILYSTPKTIEYMHKVWQLRQQGLGVYFTQDAGPNLKLLFLEQDLKKIQNTWQDIIIITNEHKS